MARQPGLDMLKGVAMFLVVFNHALLWPMREGDVASSFMYGIAFGSVAVFSAVAGYLYGIRPRMSVVEVLKRRAEQLLIPWAVWMPIYALAPLLWEAIGGRSLPIGFEPHAWAIAVILGGGPLWFLPVIFAATVVCVFLNRWTESWWPMVGAVAVYVFLAIAASVENMSPLDLGNGTFWGVWPLYVAAFWYGFKTARAPRPPYLSCVPHLLWGCPWCAVVVVMLSLVAGGTVTLCAAEHPDAHWLMWLPYGIGLFGGCASLSLVMDASLLSRVSLRWFVRWLIHVGEVSRGVYVLHPLLLAPLSLLTAGSGGVFTAAGIACITLGIEAPLVFRLRTAPVLRRTL